MARRIIGVVGFAGAGKDTIADYLQNFHEFKRDSFASNLKDACSSIFGWDRELLEGRTKESRAWREEIDLWWATRLNMPDLTPRLVLQQWGTNCCRNHWHDDIWIASLENKLRKSEDDIVISDVRFTNEVKMIKQLGGQVVRVRRGAEPEWYATALRANLGSEIDQTRLKDYNVHVSETAWIGTDFDHVIENNGSVDELYSRVKAIL
jgi:hypothetical protein